MFPQKSAKEIAYAPTPSCSDSDNVYRKISSSKSEIRNCNSKASYSPLQIMSTKSRGDDCGQSYDANSFLAQKGFSDNEDEGDGEVGDDEDEDDEEGGDKDKGSEVDDGHTETSGNSDESKDRKSMRKGRVRGSVNSEGLPPKSKAIPMLKSAPSLFNAMGQGGSEAQRDTSNHLIAGSPLQSLSAYNLDQDQLSSYQKRWIHDRDRDRDLVGSISRSGSAQSLPHSAQ